MNPIAKTLDYLRSSRAELEKVTWPTRQDVIRYTSLVIGVSIVLAVGFAALDLGLSNGVSYLVSHRVGSSTTGSTSSTNQAPVVPDLQPASVDAVDKNGQPANVSVTGTK